MGIKNKTYHTRYLNYYIEFPDGETWRDNVPFANELQFEMRNWKFLHDKPYLASYILSKGEASWKDNNSIKHTVKISNNPEPRVWGARRQSGID